MKTKNEVLSDLHEARGNAESLMIAQHCVELVCGNPYWANICKMASEQRIKGMRTYGQGLEDNLAEAPVRIQYLQEELIDALMYCEWIKDAVREKCYGED